MVRTEDTLLLQCDHKCDCRGAAPPNFETVSEFYEAGSLDFCSICFQLHFIVVLPFWNTTRYGTSGVANRDHVLWLSHEFLEYMVEDIYPHGNFIKMQTSLGIKFGSGSTWVIDV